MVSRCVGGERLTVWRKRRAGILALVLVDYDCLWKRVFLDTNYGRLLILFRVVSWFNNSEVGYGYVLCEELSILSCASGDSTSLDQAKGKTRHYFNITPIPIKFLLQDARWVFLQSSTAAQLVWLLSTLARYSKTLLQSRHLRREKR